MPVVDPVVSGDHVRQDVSGLFIGHTYPEETTNGTSYSFIINFRDTTIEPISKRWIRVQGKAQGGEKAEHTREYVRIGAG